MSALLELRDVALIRGGRLLFEGVELTLAPGGAAVITGPNGVGKSSLMRLAAGLLRASAGEVRRGGAAALADESLALDTRLTLGRALDFWARLDGVDATAGLEAMGIAHLAAVPVRMLSTGQRKRATLARVVASGAPAQSPPEAMFASMYMGLCMSAGVFSRRTSLPSTNQAISSLSQLTA